jgi:integrase
VAQLCERYITECKPEASHRYTLSLVARSPIGKKIAVDLQARDVIHHCQMRRVQVSGRTRKPISATTVLQDLTFLKGVLDKAKNDWNINTAPQLIDQVKPELENAQLIGKSVARTRLPTEEEHERLISFLLEQSKDKRNKIPMAVLAEFALWSARRISENCNLLWADVNYEKKTCIVRGIITPKTKVVRDHEFPLLGKAWDIATSQPRPKSDDPMARIFPYNSHSASAKYTAAKKRLGIKDLRFNDFRRAAAKHLLKQGFDLAQVLQVVGRGDVSAVLKELGMDMARRPMIGLEGGAAQESLVATLQAAAGEEQ